MKIIIEADETQSKKELARLQRDIAHRIDYRCAVEIREPWTTVYIPNSDLLTVAESQTPVSTNGQISIGRRFAGKWVRAYVIEIGE